MKNKNASHIRYWKFPTRFGLVTATYDQLDYFGRDYARIRYAVSVSELVNTLYR